MSIAVIRNMDTQGASSSLRISAKRQASAAAAPWRLPRTGQRSASGSVCPGIPVPKNSGISWSLYIKTSAAGLQSATPTASWRPKDVICRKAHRSQRNCALLSRRAEKCFLNRASARRFPTAPGRLPHCFRSL